MEKIFLDANVFIDLVNRKKDKLQNLFTSKPIFIIPNSIEVYTYLFKLKMPNEDLTKIIKSINIVDVNTATIEKSLTGPFDDFEDNIQIHSAVYAECDIFLTNDAQILKLGFFGTTKICKPDDLFGNV